jgi:hypothetical protein
MHFSESAPQITPGTGLKTKAPRKFLVFVGLYYFSGGIKVYRKANKELGNMKKTLSTIHLEEGMIYYHYVFYTQSEQSVYKLQLPAVARSTPLYNKVL